MGKTYRRDSGNDRWRKKAQQRHDKRNRNNNRPGTNPPQQDVSSGQSYSPFDDPPEHHENFA